MLLTLFQQNAQITADNNKVLPKSCCFEAYGKINAVLCFKLVIYKNYAEMQVKKS
jgi:hypothetical protein